MADPRKALTTGQPFPDLGEAFAREYHFLDEFPRSRPGLRLLRARGACGGWPPRRGCPAVPSCRP
jgi:hypothetical protein